MERTHRRRRSGFTLVIGGDELRWHGSNILGRQGTDTVREPADESVTLIHDAVDTGRT